VISMNSCEICMWNSYEEFWTNQNRSEEAHDWGNTHYQKSLNLPSQARPHPSPSFRLVMRGPAPERRLAGGHKATRLLPLALPQASWEIHLFQNQGTKITHQRNVLSASSPPSGLLDKMRHKWFDALSRALSASWQHQLRPGPEHTRNPVAQRM
jgi:hypothetical protein